MPDPITQVVFQNAGVLTLQGGFTTFGQTFRAGDLMPGQQLLAEIGGQLVPVQVDVRNTYPDGSVRMAVLTLERPALSPWQEATAALLTGDPAAPSAAVSLPQVLAGHSASLTLAIEDGRAPLTIDIGAAVAQAIANGTASFWQQGPYATQARVEIPVENSSMRVVLDVTGYADGEIRFTIGLNNDRAMEAVGGRLNYVATVTLDGATVFEQGLSHAQYQRVSLDFASSEAHGIQGLGAPQEGWLNIKHDIEYLKSTGAVFQYNTEFVSDPGTLRYYYNQVANNPQWGEVFWTHDLQPQMGTAGGRPDIGYTTASNAHWILSQDAAAAAYALGQAKAAGYVPWNFYDMANGTVLNTDNYPRLWTDGRGGTGMPGNPDSGGLTQQIPIDAGWTADRAHQPDLSFVPYLLTGERWIYDNVMTQASHSIMSTWPWPRQDGTGNVIQDSQLRSAAWSLRQIDHAAWIAADGSGEQDYFARKLADNLNWILANAPTWSQTYGDIAGFIPSAAWGGYIPPWQTSMFAGVVALAAMRGSDEARQVLDFMSNFLIGAVTSAELGFDPHNAVVRSMPTIVNGVPLTTWEQVADALRAEGSYGDGVFVNTELEYKRLLVAGLAMAYEATGDVRYRDAVEAFLKLQPPGVHIDNYARLPQFAVTIPDLHDQYAGDPAYPTRTHDPVSILLGDGQDEIVLSISQDYFNGSAQYRVFINGNQVGGTLTASALKSLAEADTVTIRGDFGDTITVRVQMVNDFLGSSTARDRNLYVNAITYNGQDLPTRAYLANNTPQDFVFKADGTMISPPALVKPEPNAVPLPAIDPLPPKMVILGDGPDEVVISINQDWHLESAKYVVLLNGKQVGGVQEAAAFRSAGETDTLILRGHFSDGPASIGIRFINDQTDGYGRDRNLYVQSATFRGEPIDILPKKSLMAQNETATIAFDRPDVTPKTVLIGSGPDAVTFTINQNYWKGKSEYIVLVNGEQLGERQTVNALLANGEYDTVTVRGTFPLGTKIGLQFMNDTHVGPNQGRDIFVHAATKDGQALAVSQWGLLTTGHVATATIGVLAPETQPTAPRVPQVPAAAPAEDITPKMVELGTGADEVVIRLNQDWFVGSAEYVVLVDGVQLGGVQVAGALRARGETDTLTIRGDFEVSTTIAIRFVNDAHYGHYNSDRNLFIQSATVNGVAIPVAQKNLLLTGDTATVDLSAAGPALPPPPASVPAPEPAPPPAEPPPVVVEPAPEPPATETIVFALTPRNPHSQGVLTIEANGERVFDGALAASHPKSPWTVALDVAVGESTEFVLSYATSGASSLPRPGPALVGVAHDGIALPTLSYNFPTSGMFRFTLHNGRPEDGVMTGSAGADVFMLTGADARITTGAGRDLLVVRDDGRYRVTDFDPAQDRLMFEGMAAASLSATQQGQDMVISFAGGSVVLEKTGLLALGTIVLNAEPLLA
jgi:hypothetical protein